jgi:hypothetical protein
MIRLMRILPILFAALVAAGVVRGQTVFWSPASGTLARGQTSPLSLVFENCSPSSDVSLPSIDGLQIGRPSTSSQTSIVNFKSSQRTVFTYPVVPTATQGQITIPEFDVETDQGIKRVTSASFDVGEATVGRSNTPLERLANSTLTAEPAVVWAGQVFDLKYRLLIARRANPSGVGNLDWTAPSWLSCDSFGKFDQFETNSGGELRIGVASSTRGSIAEPGTHQLPPARQPINLVTGGSAFDFFGRQTAEQYLVTTSPASVQVRPLPLPAPADFTGAVGQFTFTSKVVPTTATVGEPVTWTLALEGTGNWSANPSLPSRDVSRDFRALKPSLQKKNKEGTLFEGSLTEDVVLMPTKPGKYTLGPVSCSYFDPASGTYKTIRTEAVTVTITPQATDANAPATPGANGTVMQFGQGTTITSNAVTKAPAPELPGRLPMEALDGAATARRPWKEFAATALLAPLPAILVLWILLGWRRAALTDPRRGQRTALASLPSALAAVQSASDAPARQAAVRNWQQLAAEVWGTAHAAPTPDTIAAAVMREFDGATSAHADIWSQLWHDADRYLYANSGELPHDWHDRASTAAKGARLRSRSGWSALHPSNLWPALAISLLIAGAAPSTIAAEAGHEAYQKAEFSRAEEIWRASVSASPDNWKLRHNLGLAVAQQQRWSEAAASWGVAFLAAPRDPMVRWHLALGLERAEFTQPELQALSSGQGLGWLARFASPAEWQLGAVAGIVSIALALASLLLSRHFPERRLYARAAIALGLAGPLTLATCFAALHAYGRLADPSAVLVWKATELHSVPTEAGEQKTEPLSAGTIAIQTGSFLGWDQMLFPNGQTGWARRDFLQPLYPKSSSKPVSKQ